MGQVVQVEDATGNSEYYTYDRNDNVISIKDPKGNTMSFVYDKAGNIVSQSDKNGNATHFEYNQNNNNTKIIDALGYETAMIYDGYGRLTKTTNPRGATSENVYDAEGNLVKMVNALGEAITMDYDAEGNLLKVTNSNGIAIENYTYNDKGQTKNIKDENGNIIESYDYNEDGNLIKTTNAFGYTTQSVYDSKYGYVIKTINEINAETSFEYNENGNIIKITDALGGIVNYEYDITSQPTKIIDANDGLTNFIYDLNDNLITEDLSIGSKKTYSYDSLNRIKSFINARGQIINFGYDSTNFPTNIGGETYTYDANGNLLTSTNNNGTIKRTYDALNRMTSFTNIDNRVIKYSYDEVSNITSITYPDGEVVKYDYDLLNQLIKVTDYKGRMTEYVYNDRGLVTKSIMPDGNTEIYSYDILDRLIEKTIIINKKDYVISYEYDKTGKLLSETLIDIPDDSNKSMINALMPNSLLTYKAGNIVDTYNNQKITNDADGNMINGPINGIMTNFSYDKFNRLNKVLNTEYLYDGEGTRIKQLISGKETSYVTDTIGSLSRLLLKSNPDGTEEVYVYGNGLISQETKYLNTKKEVVYNDYRVFFYDYRGSAIALTNTQGQITDTFTYGPYGELLSQKGNTDTIFKYLAKYGLQTDKNSLIYVRNRYYSTELKRFISMDPVKDGDNWFAYVGGNPISYIDFLGYSRYGLSGNLIIKYFAEAYEYDSNYYPIWQSMVELNTSWDYLKEMIMLKTTVETDYFYTHDLVAYTRDLEKLIEFVVKSWEDVILKKDKCSLITDINSIKLTSSIILSKSDSGLSYTESILIGINDILGKVVNANFYGDLYFPTTLDRSSGNAFIHARYNMYMTEKLGYNFAKFMGDAHEFGYPNNVRNGAEFIPTLMDLKNNEIGPKLGLLNKSKKELKYMTYNGLLYQIVAASFTKDRIISNVLYPSDNGKRFGQSVGTITMNSVSDYLKWSSNH